MSMPFKPIFFTFLFLQSLAIWGNEVVIIDSYSVESILMRSFHRSVKGGALDFGGAAHGPFRQAQCDASIHPPYGRALGDRAHDSQLGEKKGLENCNAIFQSLFLFLAARKAGPRVPRASAVYRGAKNCPSKIYETPSFNSRSINNFELRTYNRKFELIKKVPLIFK
jgi:hypothetical protein